MATGEYQKAVTKYLTDNNDELLVLSYSPPIFANEDGHPSLLALALENPLSFFKRNIDAGLRLSCEGSNSGQRDVSVYAHKVLLDVNESTDQNSYTGSNKIEVRFINTAEFCHQIGRGNPVWVSMALCLQKKQHFNSLPNNQQVLSDENNFDQKQKEEQSFIFVNNEDVKEITSLLSEEKYYDNKEPAGVFMNDHVDVAFFRIDDHKFYSCAMGMASGIIKKCQARARQVKKKDKINKQLHNHDEDTEIKTLEWILNEVEDSFYDFQKKFKSTSQSRDIDVCSPMKQSAILLDDLQAKFEKLRGLIDDQFMDKKKKKANQSSTLVEKKHDRRANNEEASMELETLEISSETTTTKKPVFDATLNVERKMNYFSEWHRRLTKQAISQLFSNSKEGLLQKYLQEFNSDLYIKKEHFESTENKCDINVVTEAVDKAESSLGIDVKKEENKNMCLRDSDKLSKVLKLNINPLYATNAIHVVQSGSFLYGLATKASDEDYDVIYLCPAVTLYCELNPPARIFESHSVDTAFGSDKAGEIEFNGYELSRYIELLMKGNPKTVELLFIAKDYQSPVLRKWPWNELVCLRKEFLNHVTVSQYFGWIGDRLSKMNESLITLKQLYERLKSKLSTSPTENVVETPTSTLSKATSSSATECTKSMQQQDEVMKLQADISHLVSAASKLGYHALSKLFEVSRILKCSSGVLHQDMALIQFSNFYHEETGNGSNSHHDSISNDSGDADGNVEACTNKEDEAYDAEQGEPMVHLKGIEKEFILNVRNIKAVFTNINDVKADARSASNTTIAELESVSLFISNHLERLSQISRKDSKHKVAKRTKQLENQNEEMASSSFIKAKKAEPARDDEEEEEEEEDDDDEGRKESFVVDIKECVDWKAIGEWLLSVRIRQLYEEFQSESN